MTPFDVLTSLAACLKVTLEDAGVPPCWNGVMGGDAVPIDMGGCKDGRCGQSWTRLGSGYPATVVGQQNVSPSNCDQPLGYDVEMGVMRCVRVDKEGRPVDPTGAARVQLQDMMLMRRAIFCCDDIDPTGVVLNSYQPSGPLGGMQGGTWLLHMLEV